MGRHGYDKVLGYGDLNQPDFKSTWFLFFLSELSLDSNEPEGLVLDQYMLWLIFFTLVDFLDIYHSNC